MEKKLAKIQSIYNQISDEKDAIVANLQIILLEVKTKLDECTTNQNEIQKFLSYEFNILQKLTEINFDLETVIEDKLSYKEQIDNKSLLGTDSICCSEPVSECPSLSLGCVVELTEAPSPEESEPEIDISVLKENVKKFTEKLGLNEQLVEYNNYYKKSSNCMFDELLPERDNREVNPSVSELKSNKIQQVSKIEEEHDSTDYESISSVNTVHGIHGGECSSNSVNSDTKTQLVNNSISLNNTHVVPLQTNALQSTSGNIIKNNLKMKKKKKKKANVKCELFEKESPKVGTLCAFSHIETPNEFYIHVVDEYAQYIDQIPDLLKQSSNVPAYRSKEEAFQAIGRYCIVFITKENEWYRAEVLLWNLDIKSDIVTIKLCDYGNRCIVDYHNLRKLNENFCSIPKLAVKCHLPYIYPPESTHVDRLTEWPMSSIDALTGMSELLESGEQTNMFRIVYAQKEGNSVAIDLCKITEENNEKTVGQILLDLGLAVQYLDDVDEDNIELERFLEDAHTYGTSNNINEAVAGYDARDEARICRFTKSDGTCFKGKNCKLEHVPYSRGGFTTDSVPIFKEAFYDLVLPQTGSKVLILITGSINITHYYAQFVINPLTKGSYAMDQALYNFIKTMNNPKVVSKYEKYKIWPAIGEICLVYHWTDKWLRGIVRTIRKNDTKDILQCNVEVFMLDYGDVIQTTVENLRQINENYLQLPFQAFQCQLYGYKQKANVNEVQAKQFFEKNMYYKNFWAITKCNSIPLEMSILTAKDVDIGIALEEYGFIEKTTENFCAVGSIEPA